MYATRYGVGIECSRREIDFEQTPCMAKVMWRTRRATHNTSILTNSACARRSMLSSHELAINQFRCRGMTHTFLDFDDKAETYTHNISRCPSACKGTLHPWLWWAQSGKQVSLTLNKTQISSTTVPPPSRRCLTQRESTNGLEVPQDCYVPRFLDTQDIGRMLRIFVNMDHVASCLSGLSR
jgi:hypothetical protein